MVFISWFAIFFVVWWLVLFAVLPIGMRTQEEAEEVILGTAESAPAVLRLVRTAIITTIVAAVIVGAFWGLTAGLGYGFDDLPRFAPDFR